MAKLGIYACKRGIKKQIVKPYTIDILPRQVIQIKKWITRLTILNQLFENKIVNF
jgi:hypothetical protein